MTARVANNGSFRAALAEPMTLTTAGEVMFPEVPQDRGDYRGLYFEHFLRGVRRTPPTYVQDVLEGRPVPDDVSSRVNGICHRADVNRAETATGRSRSTR